MYCTKCGAQVRDGDKFCPSCGAALNSSPAYIDPFEPQTNYNPPPVQQPQNQWQQTAPTEENSMAILGFIFAFIFPIVGLILSIMGLKKRQYHGLAVAGVVISIITIVICVIVAIAVIATWDHYVYYPYYY